MAREMERHKITQLRFKKKTPGEFPWASGNPFCVAQNPDSFVTIGEWGWGGAQIGKSPGPLSSQCAAAGVASTEVIIPSFPLAGSLCSLIASSEAWEIPFIYFLDYYAIFHSLTATPGQLPA